MAVYHNMSAPPRTKIELSRTPVSGKIRVFSFPWALAVSKRFEELFVGVTKQVRCDPVAFRKEIPRHYKEPDAIFAKLGDPVFPNWDVDFLIGFRTLDLKKIVPPPRLCTDPLLCAGVLCRCVGTLYLSRREPEFTWERLLDLPLAFDDTL